MYNLSNRQKENPPSTTGGFPCVVAGKVESACVKLKCCDGVVTLIGDVGTDDFIRNHFTKKHFGELCQHLRFARLEEEATRSVMRDNLLQRLELLALLAGDRFPVVRLGNGVGGRFDVVEQTTTVAKQSISTFRELRDRLDTLTKFVDFLSSDFRDLVIHFASFLCKRASSLTVKPKDLAQGL